MNDAPSSPPASPAVPLAELASLATNVAQAASALIVDRINDAHTIDTKASNLDLVTEVDRASEDLITSLLLDARPDDGIIGEEGTGVSGTTGIDWVIDPIDGTTSFVYGLPGFSVSIGARVEGTPAVGTVHAPIIGDRWQASLDGGAHRNTLPCRTNSITDLSHALVATGFSPEHERRTRQGKVFAELIPQIRDLRRMGSAALDLCCVASGQLDAYFEIGLNPWDFEAGVVIVGEAGGHTLVEHDPSSGRYFVAAAAPGIAEGFFRALRELGADRV